MRMAVSRSVRMGMNVLILVLDVVIHRRVVNL